jgi:hypothetical protein
VGSLQGFSSSSSLLTRIYLWRSPTIRRRCTSSCGNEGGRQLSTSRQALLVVAYLRKGETYADLACGFKVGTSTGYRYVREARSRCSPR